MPTPRKLTDAGTARLVAVAVARFSTPTDAQLMAELHISKALIHRVMKAARDRLKVDQRALFLSDGLNNTAEPL